MYMFNVELHRKQAKNKVKFCRFFKHLPLVAAYQCCRFNASCPTTGTRETDQCGQVKFRKQATVGCKTSQVVEKQATEKLIRKKCLSIQTYTLISQTPV